MTTGPEEYTHRSQITPTTSQNEALKEKALVFVQNILKTSMILGKFGTDWGFEDYKNNEKLRSALINLIHDKSQKFPIHLLNEILSTLKNRRTIF